MSNPGSYRIGFLGRLAFVGLIFVVLGGVGLIFLIFLSSWAMDSPAVPYHKADQITVGLTQPQVKDILGEPAQVYTKKNGSVSWLYASKWKWASFEVDFTSEGLVEDSYHDR